MLSNAYAFHWFRCPPFCLLPLVPVSSTNEGEVWRENETGDSLQKKNKFSLYEIFSDLFRVWIKPWSNQAITNKKNNKPNKKQMNEQQQQQQQQQKHSYTIKLT